MWTTHLVAAVLAVVARDAETEAMNTHAVSSAVLHPLATTNFRAFHSTIPRLAKAAAVLTQASSTAIRRASLRLRAVEARPIHIALAHTMHTNPVVMALECALLLQRAFRATEALLAGAGAADTDAVARACT